MPATIISQPLQKILVVGSVYDQIEALTVIDKISHQYDWIVINGNVCYPNDGAEKRVGAIKEFISSHKAIYLAGRFDYRFANQANQDIKTWIFSLPNIAIFDFSTRPVIVTDGGIPKGCEHRKQLMDNIEPSFVSNIDDKPWHLSYNGGLGYVISNNVPTNHMPNYYAHSMQLGQIYEPNGKVYAKEVDGVGLKRTLCFEMYH